MKIQYGVILSATLFFGGCAGQEQLATGVGSVESQTEKASGETKKIYTDVKYETKKVLNSLGDGLNSIYSGILETSAAQIIVPDEYILKNRKNLIIWSNDSKGVAYNRNLKTLSDLTQFYFEEEKTKYKQNFLFKHPTPKFDKYLSDAKNLSNFYNYEIALSESKHEWDLQLDATRKKVVGKSLRAYYGKPKLQFITYNPNFLSQKISFALESEKNDFKETISLKVDSDVAKKLEKNINNVKTYIYFNTDSKNNIELVGVSLKYGNEEYLAEITNNISIYKSELKVQGSQIDYTDQELDYALMNKEIKKPDWYVAYEKSDVAVGLGYHVTLEKARELARVNLAGKIKGFQAKVTSENKKELQRTGDGVGTYSQKYKTDVKIETNVNFKARDIQEEKYNEIFFVAVEEYK